jgi:hypothetical protein
LQVRGPIKGAGFRPPNCRVRDGKNALRRDALPPAEHNRRDKHPPAGKREPRGGKTAAHDDTMTTSGMRLARKTLVDVFRRSFRLVRGVEEFRVQQGKE